MERRIGENGMYAATEGTFDGVHRGHQLLIAFLKDEALKRNLNPMVITFSRHPLEIVAPDRVPLKICDAESRDRLIREEGVDVERVDFTRELMRFTAAEWLQMLRDKYGVRMLVRGFDHTFGSDGRSMSASEYEELGRKIGVEIIEAPRLPQISSSQIRKKIAAGEMEQVAGMLGRPYSLKGKVEHGDEIGRSLGFPTANIHVSDGIALPSTGVYAAMAELSDGERYRAVVNIGYRPTVTRRGPLRIEAHLIDFKGNIYGEELKLEIIKKLREEKRFSDKEALRHQIEEDIANTSLQ